MVTGSTRLKAGTAQKLVLNMISTITMVRLGKTYGNLMVDLRATNEKLRERAVRIVATIAGVGRPPARTALEATGCDVKAAVLVACLGVTPNDARDQLARADGRLKQALQEGTSR